MWTYARGADQSEWGYYSGRNEDTWGGPSYRYESYHQTNRGNKGEEEGTDGRNWEYQQIQRQNYRQQDTGKWQFWGAETAQDQRQGLLYTGDGGKEQEIDRMSVCSSGEHRYIQLMGYPEEKN